MISIQMHNSSNNNLITMNKEQNVCSITPLKQFIESYPNEELHKQLQILEQVCPLHRIIKGDGNCFYRAFGFLYLSNYDCTLQTNYLNEYVKDDIQELWQRFIVPLRQIKKKEQRQARLEYLFNKIDQFDEILIRYFRSINYGYISKNREKFISFFESQNKFDAQLQRIMQEGSESEGIQIFALAEALQTRITIFCIDSGGFQPVYYMEHLEDKGIYLFFRPGHYDIVYPANSKKLISFNEKIKREKSKNKKPMKQWLLGQFSNGPMQNLWAQLLVFGTLTLSTYFLNSYMG